MEISKSHQPYLLRCYRVKRGCAAGLSRDGHPYFFVPVVSPLNFYRTTEPEKRFVFLSHGIRFKKGVFFVFIYADWFKKGTYHLFPVNSLKSGFLFSSLWSKQWA